MSARTLSRFATAAVAVSAFALAGCSSSGEAESSTTPTDAATTEATATASAEAGAALETVTEGVLTIATGEPAYEPWMIDDVRTVATTLTPS